MDLGRQAEQLVILLVRLLGQPITVELGRHNCLDTTAEVGDGWLPLSVTEAEAAVSRTPPLHTFEHLSERIDTMTRMRKDVQKGHLEICFAPFERYIKDWGEATAAIATNRQQYADVGVTWMTVVASARSLGQLHDDVGHFADAVISGDPDR